MQSMSAEKITREEALRRIHAHYGDRTTDDPEWVEEMVAIVMDDPDYLDDPSAG